MGGGGGVLISNAGVGVAVYCVEGQAGGGVMGYLRIKLPSAMVVLKTGATFGRVIGIPAFLIGVSPSASVVEICFSPRTSFGGGSPLTGCSTIWMTSTDDFELPAERPGSALWLMGPKGEG